MAEPNPTWLERHVHARKYIKWGIIWGMAVATFLLLFFTLGELILLKLAEAIAEWQGVELDLTSPSTEENTP